MKHTKTEKLETERLVLRRFTEEDAQAMYNNWCNSQDVTKYLMWPAHENVEDTKNILGEWLKQYEEEGFYLWAIAFKNEMQNPIGSISVVNKDDAVKMVHIGYCIGKNWWNKGVTKEALKAVIEYMFDVVGVNRVESRHDPCNANSGKVMLSCGMKYEGTLRQADWNNSGICDASYYSILKEEYKLGKDEK